jgi:serine protease Do
VKAVVLLALLALVSCTTPEVPARQPSRPADFAGVARQVAPSVVTVRTGQGLGSGVVYKPDVVVTNEHVVATSSEVTVTYADGTESGATVLARDRETDIAVLRTERADLTPARFTGELPDQGTWVLAIGSPLGLQNSVTAGIVSGLNRSLPAEDRALTDLIQTDAPISPGNSGGALVNTWGRVVGLNEAHVPPQAGAESLGFAIPAATATKVADQLLAGEGVVHVYLGVSVGDLTPDIRERLGVQAEGGALVLGVDPGSPADVAGIRPGDVIVRVGDVPVGDVDALFTTIGGRDPGELVTIVVIRRGERAELPATLAERR